MEALILVGGLGTRLGKLTKEIPKPMLDIRGKPFLHRLLSHLKEKNIKDVVLAVSYKAEIIHSYFNYEHIDIPNIIYSYESNPLGTGGAIKLALNFIKNDDFFIFNGDSFLDVDYKEMMKEHNSNPSDLLIASKYLRKAERYGILEYNKNHKITKFNTHSHRGAGYINGGVYLANKNKLLIDLNAISKSSFSFESDFLLKNVNKYNFKIFKTHSYFIDIGVRSDYLKAQRELFQ